MQLLQLSPLWHHSRQWQGILACGPEEQLVELDRMLAEFAISTHLPCYSQLALTSAQALRPFDPQQLVLAVNDVSALARLGEQQLAFGGWYTQAGPTVCAPAKPELLELVALVTSDAEIDQLELVFSRAPDLTFRLLKLVNSVGMRSRVEIASIRHAITVLGRNQLQRWVQLLMYAEQFAESGAISPLLIAALLRARRLEGWAEHGWLAASPDSAFLLGMLSLLEQLFQQPLAQLLTSLPLSDNMKAALLDKEGVLGQALAQAIHMETYLDDAVWAIHPLQQQSWIKAEVDAYRWVALLAEGLQR
ncbi:HDOD domain-containing protein [Chitinibacter sp. FCG-7]|uniref:HDOD domain-containing protein n=1 Tax=Chitinibacter mangrovi TaxID=3153927 RepID=A0AAU7FF60_9NEIS